jgi:GTP cyclohydrolase I
LVKKRVFNLSRVKRAVRDLLVASGEDINREGLRRTPERVAEFYQEALSGNNIDPESILSVYYETENYEELVLVRDVNFFSLCEHHLLPFFGRIHIAYIPKSSRLLGVSKLVRLAEVYTRRLQVQERLSQQIADAVMSVAKPYGAMVVIEAEHLCMTMRGVKKPGSKMVTSAMRGIFLKDARTRSEVLGLLNRNG